MARQATPLLEDVFTHAEFTPDDIPRLRRHSNYSTRFLQLEPVCAILAQPDLPYGAIPALADTSTIPKGTIRDWRLHLRRDPGWCPSSGYGNGRRLLTADEEAILADSLRHDYLGPGRYFLPYL
jgi:hypothetical protein